MLDNGKILNHNEVSMSKDFILFSYLSQVVVGNFSFIDNNYHIAHLEKQLCFPAGDSNADEANKKKEELFVMKFPVKDV